LGVRGFNDGEAVLPLSLPRARFANSFSSEVPSWFIKVSSEETSSSSSGELEESSSLLSSSESHSLFLAVEDSTFVGGP
jgi:hypothetical protein